MLSSYDTWKLASPPEWEGDAEYTFAVELTEGGLIWTESEHDTEEEAAEAAARYEAESAAMVAAGLADDVAVARIKRGRPKPGPSRYDIEDERADRAHDEARDRALEDR